MSNLQSKAHSSEDTGKLQLLEGSIAFFPSLIAAIDNAMRSVQMETYIFDLTASGAHVAAALERAAQRGVQVRVMVDGFGTPVFPEEWKNRFKSAGVQWLVYEPIVTLGVFLPSQWRRLHRKLCVIDNAVAYCGGINLLDDWHDPSYGTLAAPRFDFTVRVTGALAQEIQLATSLLWDRLSIGKPMNIKRVKTAIEHCQPL